MVLHRFPLRLLVLFLILGYVHNVHSVPSEVKIGGVFCKETQSKELQAFLLGVDYINNNSQILPGTRLIPVVNQTDWLDSFSNLETVYWQIYNGAVAIIGPLTSPMVKATQPLCMGFRVPQIAPYATDPGFEYSADSYPYLLRMSSSDTLENEVIADFISYFSWTRMALLTSRSDYSLNGLVSFKDIASHKGWSVVAIETFQEFYNASMVNATSQLIHIRGKGARIIILNCIAIYARVILKQARDMGMIKDYVWIVTHGTFAFQGLFSPGESVPDYLQGIIGVRPSFGQGKVAETFKTAWVDAGYSEMSFENEVAVGHTFDAVIVLASALQIMFNDGNNISNMTATFGFYENAKTRPRPEGKMLLEYIVNVNTSGIMDRLAFDFNRSPVHAAFDIVNLRPFGFQQVGHWNPGSSLVLDKHKDIIWPSGKVTVPTDSSHLIENRTLRVVTIEEHPFIYAQKKIKDGKTHLIIEGYCVELLRKLAEQLKFNFEIYLVPDQQFGSLDQVSKEWNGIVKEILQGRADLAVASLTISPDRQRVIDFTQPFLDLGLTVLLKPDTKIADHYTFFRPFRYDLWLAIGLTMIIVGFFLWFFSTFSPYGFYGRSVQTCLSKVPHSYLKYRNTLTLVRAMWSSVVYYVGQSSDHLHPVCSSGRITVAVWWFATLIIISTYTANLAAFLTIKRFISPIGSVDDLARQTSVDYGTVLNSQPQTFFESATVPTFVTMWQYMKYHHSFVTNSEQGIDKVINGNYAFIWDSVVLEYVVHNQDTCNSLITSGNVFGRIGYGFGLAKGSPYTKQLSNEILKLRHSGYMEVLDRKWLHRKDKCDNDDAKSGDIVNQLTFEDLAGVFIVVCAGIGVSCLVLVIEWIWAARQDTKGKLTEGDGTRIGLITALCERRRRAFHDWHRREDVPNKRRATVMWADSILPFVSALRRKFRRSEVGPCLEEQDEGESTMEDLEEDGEEDDDSYDV